MNPYRDINDEEWQSVAPLLPELRPRSELRGCRSPTRERCSTGVLWVMHSGATWSAMPRKYPSYQTCHRRFKVSAIDTSIAPQGFVGGTERGFRSGLVQIWYDCRREFRAELPLKPPAQAGVKSIKI